MKQAINPTSSHLQEWFTDDPTDPGRMLLNDPDVQELASVISPESQPSDLGGVMSLNVKLEAADLVLRVHQPFVSRQRLLAVQAVRRELTNQGLVVPRPRRWNNTMVFRCDDRWAELDEYLPHKRLAPTFEAYTWLFRAMGKLHVVLKQVDLVVPRPLVATYAPPGSLRRWLSVTETAVQSNSQAAKVAQQLRAMVRQLRQLWVPANELPVQLIHGDVRLSNVCQAEDGRTVYFDFGFLAWRPRIYELAYALAFMIPSLEGLKDLDNFAWEHIPWLVEEYEAAAKVYLSPAERKALLPYTASVPLYAATLDGFTENPAGNLLTRRPFLELSTWLLANHSDLRNKLDFSSRIAQI